MAHDPDATAATAPPEPLAARVLDALGDPLLVVDVELTVAYANRSFYDLFRADAATTLGKHVSELGNGQWNIPALLSLLTSVLAERRPFDDFAVSHAFPRISRRTVVLGGRPVAPVDDRDAPAFAVVTIRDLTTDHAADSRPGDRHDAESAETGERRYLEAQLRQAQKMEAVGRLASGIAHDFNDLLTVITGHSELLAQIIDRGTPAYEGIREIHDAARRAAALTRQLLAFGRRQVLQPRLIAVSSCLAAIEPMIRRLIGEDIEVILDIPQDIGAVMADPGQLDQVLINLAVNARDAMPDGGVLAFTAANVDLGHHDADSHATAAPGSYVMVAVSDTGYGMDRATLARVFEPFFTTKSSSRGTGLGLSTVYEIVKQSGGYISAYSEPGFGTTFKIYLPRAMASEGSLSEGSPSDHGA